ncbi:MAG: GNAT family N-acetyltransferase [Deltaproteobacteria bacterium]|nr:GNAT family N-acetyltransferase [Deltaproteobacteria bacterium]
MSNDPSKNERPILLRGDKVALAMMSQDDVPSIARWHQNLEFTAMMGFPGEVQTSEMREEAYQRSTRIKDDAIEFGILQLATHRLVGFGGLFNMNAVKASFFVGISPDHWGAGLGTEATQLICEYGFFFRSLSNIHLDVKSYNHRAIRVYERVGFKHVGRLRNAVVYNGRHHDEVLMDMVRADMKLTHVGSFASALEPKPNP